MNQEIKPIVMGRDLINLGFKPGPEFRRILGKAFERQLDGWSYEEIIEAIIREEKSGQE